MDLLPFYIYWMLGGDISSCEESAVSGICIPPRICADIIKGLNIGSCGKTTDICCQYAIHHEVNSASHATLPNSMEEGNLLNHKLTNMKEEKNSLTSFPTNVSSSEENHAKIPAINKNLGKVLRNLTPPVDHRKPVDLEVSHSLRIPVEHSVDFHLQRPVIQEDSHDLRWPVVEENSHDLRNPISLHPTVVDDKDHNRNSIENVDSSTEFDINDYYYPEDILPEFKYEYKKCAQQFLNKHNYKLNITASSNQSEIRDIWRNWKMLDAALNVCGISGNKLTAKLIGGKESAYLQWPWMVSLCQRYQDKLRHKCGATLLNNEWVITAAHCVQWSLKWRIFLKLGSHTLGITDELFSPVFRAVDKIIIHPRFDPITFENDVALLLLNSPVEFRPNIAPICLPRKVGRLDGRTAVVLGWGKQMEGGALSSTLQELHLPLLTNRECEQMYARVGPKEVIMNGFICAGTSEGGSDACDGDSGGPMALLDSNGRWSLIGLVSWGKVCGGPNQPGVYTRIATYLKWIEINMACHTLHSKN